MKSLEFVLINDTKVTDAGLKHLKGLTKLERLYLSDTKVTDAGLMHLTGLTKLKTLSLRNTKVTDAGLEHLKGLTELQTLELNSTEVTDPTTGDFTLAPTSPCLGAGTPIGAPDDDLTGAPRPETKPRGPPEPFHNFWEKSEFSIFQHSNSS